MVDEADSPCERHSDGHAGLGHRVHGRGDERSLQRDPLGQRRGQVHLVRREVDVPGQDEEIVVGEPIPAAEELLRRQPVVGHVAGAAADEVVRPEPQSR